MAKGDTRGFSQVIAGRVHVIITNAATTLKPYENAITLVASSEAYTVTLPQPSEAEDRLFTFKMSALATSCGVAIHKPSAGSTAAVLSANLKYTDNYAVLYCDGRTYFTLASSTSSS